MKVRYPLPVHEVPSSCDVASELVTAADLENTRQLNILKSATSALRHNFAVFLDAAGYGGRWPTRRKRRFTELANSLGAELVGRSVDLFETSTQHMRKVVCPFAGQVACGQECQASIVEAFPDGVIWTVTPVDPAEAQSVTNH